MRYPLARLLVLALAFTAAAGFALAQTPPATPPTPDFTFNNFKGSSAGFGGAGNFLDRNNAAATLTLNATSAGGSGNVIDRVLLYPGSALQTVTGFTTNNDIVGTFVLNSMVFAANTNSQGGVTISNLTGAANPVDFVTNAAGVLPSIYQQGTGRVAFSHADPTGVSVTLGQANTPTTLYVLGSGTGDVYLNTTITTASGAGASGLAINETGTRSFFSGSQVRLGGSASTFTGGVNLISGNLVLTNVTSANVLNQTVSAAATPVNSLGTAAGTLTINGGSVQFDPLYTSNTTTLTTGTLQVNNPLTLNSTLNLTGSIPVGNGTNTAVPSGNIVGIFGGAISGSAGITASPVSDTLVYAFTGANTFSGPVVVAPVGNTVSTIQLGTAGVSTGAFTGTTSFTIGGSSGLTLNNVAGVQERLNTVTAPSLTLNRSTVSLLGNASASVTETFGQLTVNGQGTVVLQSGSATANSATLVFSGLNRGADNRGTLSVVGQNLGSGTGAGEGVLAFTTAPDGATGGNGAPGTTTQNILPYVVANAQNFSANATGTSAANTPLNATATNGNIALGLVRYDATSSPGRIVPLTSAEYASNLYLTGATAPSANMRLTTTSGTAGSVVAGVDRATVVNSLVLDTGTSASALFGSSVQGAGTLTVGGGAVLVGTSGSGANAVTIPSTINLGGLDFGVSTGYFHTNSSLTVNAPITGSAGVVKSLANTLILNGTNTFTGGLTVANGPVQFSTDANLGAAGEPITLNSGNATALQYLPSNLYTAAATPALTVNRPVTIGAAGAVINVNLPNDTLTLSGALSGTGQLGKFSLGNLALTGNSLGYSGNVYVGSGILTANSDAALGTGSLILAGGTFQPAASFATSRDVLVTNQSTIFTGGQNLTLNGNLTAQNSAGAFTLFKTGNGDLTLTAANTFNGAFQLGESNPTIRSTTNGAQGSGRLVLSGPDGSLAQATTVFSIGGGEVVLDNTASVNNNRLGSVTLSLVGGNATLLGNGAAPVTEQIGALSVSNGNNQYGGRLTLVTPAGTNQVTTLTATSYAPQTITTTATNVGALFVRGTNLGSTTANTDRTAVILGALPATSGGLIPSIVVATSDAAADATDFATTAPITNAAPNASQYRLVPFTGYNVATSGSLGVGAAANTYDLTAAASFTGSPSNANAIRLRGGSLDLNGSTLTLASGDILTTGGTNVAVNSTGGTTGTLNYAAGVSARFFVAAGSDLTLNASVVGNATTTTFSGGFLKSGTGVLTLNQPVTMPSATNSTSGVTATGLFGISAGTLRYGVKDAFPTTTQPFINAGAVLDIAGTTSTLGGLNGFGGVNIGAGGTLTLAVTAAPLLPFGGTLSGSGTLVKTGSAAQILIGDSPLFTGDVQVLGGTNTGQQAGGLVLNSNGALGVGTTPILLGATSGTAQASLAIGSSVTTFTRDITVQAGSAPTTPHTFATSASTTAINSNIILGGPLVGQNLRITNSSNNTGNASLNGTISGAGRIEVFFGSFTFNGTNTYTGGTLIDSGSNAAIGVGNDSGFGTGAITFTSVGGNIRADGGTRTLANNVVLNAGASTGAFFGVAGTNPVVFNGGFNLNAGAFTPALNIQNTAVTTINGAITNGTNGIAKNGPGVLVSNGVNTYTGPTAVNAGTLYLNGTSPLSTGAVTVNPGAILGGTGTVAGAVTVAGNGVLAPGAGSGAGTLTAANGVTFSPNSVFAVRLTDGTTPAQANTGGSTQGPAANPTSNNYLNITGGTTVFDSTTRITIDGTNVAFTPFVSYSYRVAAGAGTQANLPIGNATQFTVIGFQVDPSSLMLSQNVLAAPGEVYLSFTPVPEPATVLGLSAAALLAASRLRRRAAAV